MLVDIDGTLVDSNYVHTLAWSRALREHGEWAPMSTIHRSIGMGSDHDEACGLGRQVNTPVNTTPSMREADITNGEG